MNIGEYSCNNPILLHVKIIREMYKSSIIFHITLVAW